MIKNMDERILAELEIKKLEEMKTENKLSEDQLNKLNEWITSINKQIADFDATTKVEEEEKTEESKEVENVDAPFLVSPFELQLEESIQPETTKYFQNSFDDWMSHIHPLRPFQYYLGGDDKHGTR